MTLPDAIGWIATSVFTASYLTTRPASLRRVQMAGASLWFGYGVVTRATPVMVANLLVLGAACWAEVRERRSTATCPSGPLAVAETRGAAIATEGRPPITEQQVA
jgi:hypothetical protein